MASSVQTIKIGGCKFMIEAGDVLKTLYQDSAVTGAETMHELSDGSNYQVPGGKTFTILGVRFTGGGASNVITVFQGDSLDSTTGEVDKFVFADNSPDNSQCEIGLPDLTVVAASKFVNMKITSTSNSPASYWIYGVES